MPCRLGERDVVSLLTSCNITVCHHMGVDEAELAGRTRRIEIARALALIGYIATQELLISGSELARRFNIDRSAVSRAARRAAQDPEDQSG